MNFDLIIKLIKLANNNPNDNEANLAARKVCRMLAGHFEPKVQPKVEIRQPTTWNDVQRSSEPEFKSKRQTASQQNQYKRPPSEPPPVYEKEPFNFTNVFDQFFREQERARERYTQRPPREYTIPKDDNHYYQPYTPPSKQKEERLLKCRTCGNSKLTKFVGLAEVFECNTCQWTAYEKRANKMET